MPNEPYLSFLVSMRFFTALAVLLFHFNGWLPKISFMPLSGVFTFIMYAYDQFAVRHIAHDKYAQIADSNCK